MSLRYLLVVTVVLFALTVRAEKKVEKVDKKIEKTKKIEWIRAEMIDDYTERFSAPHLLMMETSASFHPSPKLFQMSEQQRQQEYMYGYDHGFEHGRSNSYPRFAESQNEAQAAGISDPLQYPNVANNAGAPYASQYYTRYGIYNNQQPPYYSPYSPYYSYPPPPPPMPTYLPPPPYIPPSPQPAGMFTNMMGGGLGGGALGAGGPPGGAPMGAPGGAPPGAPGTGQL